MDRIVLPQEEGGFDLTSEEDKQRHKVARNGDHLLISFQYKLCHFRNLKGLDPGKCDADIRLLRTIRRATLDAFWAREPSTVEATRRDSKKIVETSQSLGLDDTLPEMRPFPLHDIQGMGLAVCILVRSLDKGRYQSTLQYKSVRKLRSAYSNVWYASKHTLTTSVMAQDVRKTYVTSCPSYSLWFARFMTGMHKRMGDIVKQDKTVTLDVIHRLVEGLEEDLLTELEPAAKENISDAALFILASFLGGIARWFKQKIKPFSLL